MDSEVASVLLSSTIHTSATATAIIAVVTTVYAVVSYLQWQTLGRANDINAENIYAIQRPFITVPRIDPAAFFVRQPDAAPATLPTLVALRLNPRVENAGNTPAKSLVIYINYDVVRDRITSDYTFPDLSDVIRYPAVGGPKQVIPVPDRTFDGSRVRDFQSEAQFRYIYGRAEYKDFLTTNEHVTMFCFQVTGPGPVVGASQSSQLLNSQGAVTLGFPACERHNCKDQECRDEGFVK
jgi:hypothetical protein